MGDTKIEWTDKSWNPLRGCTPRGKGCDNCYAALMAARFSKPGQAFEGLAEMVNGRPRWTGVIRLVPEVLDAPLRWRKPCMVFVNSVSDLFHANVPFEFVDRVWAVMALAPQHTFQILTKRPDRMREYFGAPDLYQRVLTAADEFRHGRPWTWGIPISNPATHPLRNVWLGASVVAPEYKPWIEHLRKTPAAVRFISFEPLLADMGEVDLTGIHWAIVGGESGPRARPMHPDWALSLRDQCKKAGVPYFFKQWGAWAHYVVTDGDVPEPIKVKDCDEEWWKRPTVHVWRNEIVAPPGMESYPVLECSVKVGKDKAGRLLDGVLWDQMPEVVQGE